MRYKSVTANALPTCKRTQQLPTLLARKCWELWDGIGSDVQTDP